MEHGDIPITRPIGDGEVVSSRDELRRQLAESNARRERVDLAPTSTQRLGQFTVSSLILNRTIGSGIFAQPTNILALTGSSGVAIALWGVGGLIVLAIVLCWLELCMTVPFFHYVDEDGAPHTVSTPRSGGDKNFLEYIYHKPKFLATCVFGVIYIVFGHLAANAIQFGVFAMTAISPECQEGDACFNKAAVLGWAIGVVTLCALINVSARQFAIRLNNVFAVAKVLFVAALGLTGIIYGTVHGDGCRRITWQNQGSGGGFGDIVLALVFATYPYTGFEQPFYVLAEVKAPKRTFPRATILTMLLIMVLFPLTNVGYLCTTPYEGNDSLPRDMVTAMFERMSGVSTETSGGSRDRGALRAVSAILSVSIFANIMAQTFTASRVKQELGKEGVFPLSRYFATGSDSLVSKLWSPAPRATGRISEADIDYHPEQVPIGATVLHWSFEVALILLIGIPFKPTTAYRLLTSVKMFTIVGVLGLFTVAGLLYLKIDSWIRVKGGRNWYDYVQFLPFPPLDFLPAIVATVGLALLLFGTFAPPTEQDELPHWVGPLAAWAITAASVGWWLWLKFDLKRNREILYQERRPFIEPEEEGGELVCKAEFVVFERLPARARHSMLPK